MNRGFAILLLCAPIAFGQKSRVPPPPPPAALLLDAVVTDAQGRPVAGLASEDFEISHADQPQKVARLTWFDTRSHAAKTATPPAAPNLSPGDIRRNIVLIVDDLGLSPERTVAMQQLLRTFVDEQLAPDDWAVIVRTSSGSGWEQQLTTDHRALAAQIEHVHPLGRGLSDAAYAGAMWQCVRWATDGLYSLPGRKAVVLLSEHLQSALPGNDAEHEFVRRSMALAAHRAMMVFYTVDPRGPAELPQGSMLSWLVKETGGMFAPDLPSVLRDQEGYYVIEFRPAQEGMAATPAVLQLHGKVGILRWRFGFLPREQPQRAPVPLDRTTGLQQALTGATGGAEIRTRVTASFAGFSRAGAQIDCLVHIDARDLSVMRSLKGTRSLSAEVQIAVYGDSGRVTGPPGRTYALTLEDAAYGKALEQGLVYNARLTLPNPGGYQVRAVVADGIADHFGSAMQFLEVPPANQGRFSVSGLLVKADTPAKPPDGAGAAQSDLAAIRVYQPGATINFSYGVFNAVISPEKKSRLNVHTRIYATGRLLYDGRPIDLEFSDGNTTRIVGGKVQLDSRISPGEYVIEVEVTDLLAKADTPHTAVQFITFEVRE